MNTFLLTYANTISLLIGTLVGIGLNFVYARRWHELDKRPHRKGLSISILRNLGLIFLVVSLILFIGTISLSEGVSDFTQWVISFFLATCISSCVFVVLLFFVARRSLKRQEKIQDEP